VANMTIVQGHCTENKNSIQNKIEIAVDGEEDMANTSQATHMEHA
jgi:uncharacterized protein (UPF0218 family)